MALHAYLAQDRWRALARGESLPVDCLGAALFADISGFTALTEALTQAGGQRRGVEALARRINAVHEALIAEVEYEGGSVVGFAGDGMTCWFDGAGDAGLGAAAQRAARCGQRMLQAMAGFEGLAVKVGIGCGPAQRLVVGDAALHLIDLLAGGTVARAVQAEGLARAGELVVDAACAAALDWPTQTPRHAADGAAFFAGEPSTTALAAMPGAVPAAGRADPVPALPIERLQPWLLPFVFERERIGEGLFATDLRPATALFLRLLSLPGEAALPGLVALAQQQLQRQGGVLLEATVDARGLCLYGNFGAARMHEDDARRALHAALALRQALEAAGCALQIGLSSGTLCVGGYGGPTRRSFGAIGDEVNTAARLMAQAQPGEILLSGRVRQAAGDAAFVFEPRSPIAMKGKAEPMPVFALGGLQQRRAIRLQEPDALLPMVGREAEAALLVAKLAAAAAGRGQLLRVVAEAGMGKSRLVAEAVRLARRGRFIGYGGACRLDGIRAPYGVWQGIFTAFFELDPALPQRRQRHAVQSLLQLHAPAHAEAWPLLGAVLGQDWPDTPFTAALQPQDRKSLLEAMLLACLQSAAAEAAEDGMGLLLVLEDLHAADPLSLDLLLLLARGVAELPVLLLTAERPPEADAAIGTVATRLAALPQAETLLLQALGPADVEHIVRAKLALQFPERAGTVPRALIEQVAERAQGNPFYVDELLNYLHDRGLDPRRPDAVQALALPASLHALVLSRIDGLAASQQGALKAASIIGRQFAQQDLQGYCPSLGAPAAVQADLAALDRLGFTPRLPQAGEADSAREACHVFRHLVTLEVSYESLAQDTRVRLHAQFGRYLEQAHAGQLGPLAPQLAHHFERAQVRDEACRYLRQAGEQAAAAFANDEALDCFERALQWLPAEDGGTRFELLMRCQALHELQGRHEAQRAALAALERLAPGLDRAVERQAQVATQRARLEIAVGQYAAARAAAQAASALIESDAATRARATERQAEALLLEARALFFAGQAAAARPMLERALALAREGGHARSEVHALSQTGLLHWHTADYAAAEQWLQQALAASEALGDPRLPLDILNNLGVVAKSRARYHEAVGHYRQAMAIARRVGDRPGEAMLLNNLGSACLSAGDFPSAGQYAAQAARMFADAQEPVQHGLALINRAEAHRELGQYAQARSLSEQALALLRASGFRRGEAIVLENLGLAAMGQGRWAEAAAWMDHALALAREIGLRSIVTSVSKNQGLIALGRGDAATAQQALDEAWTLAQALEAEDLMLEVAAAQALLALAEPGGEAGVARAREPLARVLPALLPAADVSGQEAAPQRPMALYLHAWRALRACADPRAEALRLQACAQLQARSLRIPDAAARRDYLAIAEHQALLNGAPDA
ncbi:tetratricopeptide repeat protein [Aquabacterium sp.]|uniref:tetratricopeptide repeat protein n=1 Tax=Aquabacterium sp. TaxID=1872578 RepID=UPI003784AF5B